MVGPELVEVWVAARVTDPPELLRFRAVEQPRVCGSPRTPCSTDGSEVGDLRCSALYAGLGIGCRIYAIQPLRRGVVVPPSDVLCCR